MSFQYIHTSAKRGLEPGKSGFCCVARDRDTPPDLIQELEQQSRYHAFSKDHAPTILRHRIAHLRSGVYHILTRIQDSGTDYSKRNNHIAHHLAFTDAEVAGLPNPASILLHWSRWRNKWEEPPRILSVGESFSIQDVESRWNFGESFARLPKLIEGRQTLRRVVEIGPGEESVFIEHIRASLNDPRIESQWRYSFTNLLLPTDAPGDYVWSATWRGHALPYEIDLTPRPYATATVSPKPDSEAIREPEPAFDAEIDPTASAPKYGPTRVEIPKDFDRSQLRRPKRKLGRREMSRLVNLAVALLAILSVAVVAYWFRGNRKHVETMIEEKVDPNPVSPAVAAAARYESSWKRFVADGYPPRRIPEADLAASYFASQGNDEPAEIVAFLKRVRDSAPIGNDSPVPVPTTILHHVGSTTSFDLPPEKYPRLAQLILVPKSVLAAVADLSLDGGFPTELFAGQAPATYNPGLLAADLRAFERTSAASMRPASEAARSALAQYLNRREQTLANPQFTPLLSIHKAFGMPDSAAYLHFDDDGWLLASATADYGAFITQLFTDQVQANAESFKDRAAFRGAYNNLLGRTYASAQEAAKGIYEVILLADPKTDSEARAWSRIQDAWSAAFIRRDLMQETIIGYTIEALETERSELLWLRNQFTRRDLRDLQTAKSIAAQVEALVTRLSTPASQAEDWVVFEPQSPK